MNFTIILFVVEGLEKLLTFCIVAILETLSELNDWEKMYLFLIGI